MTEPSSADGCTVTLRTHIEHKKFALPPIAAGKRISRKVREVPKPDAGCTELSLSMGQYCRADVVARGGTQRLVVFKFIATRRRASRKNGLPSARRFAHDLGCG